MSGILVRCKYDLNCQISVIESNQVLFLQVAYEQEDYYHSVQWLEESVRLFRGTGGEWNPENEGTLEDALDHLAFSHFKVSERPREKHRLLTGLINSHALNSSRCFRLETSPTL